MMNVAIFASAFYPHIGGVEELVRQLAQEHKRQGTNPLILTNRYPKTLAASEDFEGLPVRRYVFRVPAATWKQRTGTLLFGRSTLRDVCQDVQKHHTDVLHIQCVSSNAYYALQAKQRLGLPLVVTLQGELTMDATRLFERSAFARELMRSVLAEADAITACSQQTLLEAEEFVGQPFGGRGQVIYNGIRLNDFQQILPYDHPRPYLLGIGRQVPQKGFDLLLQAFALAINSGENSHDLLLAGDGTERANLEKLASELGIASRVRFVGKVNRTDAVRLFVGCSFFVLPSRHEPLGIVNLEAMAAGKPVIAANVGGVPEIVKEGITGLLFSKENVPELQAAILELAQNAHLRKRLGEAGQAHAQCFDWSVIAGQYQQVYQKLTKGK